MVVLAHPLPVETDPYAVLPKALSRRLWDLRPVLQQQGVVQVRVRGRCTTYRLRYRDPVEHDSCRRHRTIALGGNIAVAQAVRDLIQRWRDQVRQEEEAKSAAEAAERQRVAQVRGERRETERLIRLAGIVMGRGERVIRRAIRQYRHAVEHDPRGLFLLAYSPYYLQPLPRGRRPRGVTGAPDDFDLYYLSRKFRSFTIEYLRQTDAVREGRPCGMLDAVRKFDAEMAAQRCPPESKRR